MEVRKYRRFVCVWGRLSHAVGLFKIDPSFNDLVKVHNSILGDQHFMSHNTQPSRFTQTMKQIDQKLVFSPRSREELAAWWGAFSGGVCSMLILLLLMVVRDAMGKLTVVPTQSISHPSDKVEFSQRPGSPDQAGFQPLDEKEREEVD